MAWEIFIERYQIDVPVDLSAQISYSIDDVRDFAARNTAFSKTIVLPGTAANKKVFGHIFDAGSANFVNSSNPNVNYDFDASKAAKCLIFYNGLQIFKGVIRVMNIVIDGINIEFETAVFGELGGLIAAMADKKLEDLDFSAYDHVFDLVSIVASWSGAIGSSYYYPLIDYGYSTDKIIFPIETFRPAFHVREYLDKILTDAGYTFESDFLDTDYLKKQIVPFNDQFPSIEVETVLNLTGGGFTNIPATSPTDPMGFSTIVGTPYVHLNGFINQFTWTRAEKTTLKLSVSCNWTLGGVDPGIIILAVWVNGASVYEFGTDTGSDTSGIISFSTSIDVNNGDFVEIKPYKRLEAETATISDAILLVAGQPTIKIPLEFGDSIIANDMIPKNIFQKDFLTSIVKMFNLYIYEDPNKYNHLKITPYVNFYDTTASHVEQWDNKLDRSRPYTYTPMGELNSRSYLFKFKDDNDFYNQYYKDKFSEGYGSRLFDTGFDFAKDKNTVEVIFSPTPLVQFSNSDRVISAIFKRNPDGTEERTANNIRILFRSAALVDCQQYSVTYTDPDTLDVVSTDYTGYAYAGHLDDTLSPLYDLNFGVPKEFYFTIVAGYLSGNIFNIFWSNYIAEISDKDSKLLTGFFKLDALDMLNLDFSKIKFINGNLWRLNKIIDYSTGVQDTTKCELLKVIDLIF